MILCMDGREVIREAGAVGEVVLIQEDIFVVSRSKWKRNIGMKLMKQL